MSLLKIGFAKTLDIRLPCVARYIDEKWVDEFLGDGKLRLSSFRRCAKHEDEQRHDAREGRMSLQAEAPDGSTLSAVTLPTPTLYILCCSTAIDCMHRDLFNVSSGFVIDDPFAFAAAITDALANCVACAQGPCVYQAEMTRNKTLAEPLFTEDPKSEEEIESKIGGAIRQLDKLESMFTKPTSFSNQHEYRFVWAMENDVKETIDIVSPRAAKVCHKIQFKP